MADSVSKALMLDKIPVNGKAILLVQHGDGSPFLHSLLSQAAKQNRKICLVSFNQSPGYYHSLGTRLGWNLKNLQGQERLVFVGGVGSLNGALESPNIFDFLSDGTVSPLQTLLSVIRETVAVWAQEPFTIVIDELDCLFNLGVELKHIVNFYQQCHRILESESALGCLLISTGMIPGDTQNGQCTSLLSHWSDLVLIEKRLQTGLSKDLSGALTVHWNVAPHTEQDFHFKCFDRGIKMFAPGTCSAVL